MTMEVALDTRQGTGASALNTTNGREKQSGPLLSVEERGDITVPQGQGAELRDTSEGPAEASSASAKRQGHRCEELFGGDGSQGEVLVLAATAAISNSF